MSATGDGGGEQTLGGGARFARSVGLFLGPAIVLVMLVLGPQAGLDPAAWRAAAVALLMAVWWMTEPVPIPVTALLPLALFPLLGVTDVKTTAAPYANPLVFLFPGGFVIALAMQRWNLHRRIALKLISAFGTRPANLIAGFMVATALLSMWVSNTATTATFLPIVASVAIGLRENPNLLVVPATLAASCAFMMPVATPPNAIVFGSGHVTIGQMIHAGVWLNLIGVVVITGVGYSIMLVVLGVEPGVVPEWAMP